MARKRLIIWDLHYLLCFGLRRSQANGRRYVDQNSDAEEAAPRVDAAHHLVERPDDQAAGGDHMGRCRYYTGRMREPEDRRRDEKYAEREVWCLSNGDRSRLAVAETPEQKSSHHRVCPIQIRRALAGRGGSGRRVAPGGQSGDAGEPITKVGIR